MADGASAIYKPVPGLPSDRMRTSYAWPYAGALDGPQWSTSDDGNWRVRNLPESTVEVSDDSRWPAFFPSALSIATTSDGQKSAIEKVVGAAIVNRFPYTLALSFCRTPLSTRHYERSEFMSLVEETGTVAVQFLFPGDELKQVMNAIASTEASDMPERLSKAANRYRPALRSPAPVIDGAYLIYEGRFVKPGPDFDGVPVNEAAWVDCGSHRIYMFEIETISLRRDIASGDKPIHWRSLPVWRRQDGNFATPSDKKPATLQHRKDQLARVGYQKSYRSDYVFPSPETIAFEGTPSGDFSVLDVKPLEPGETEVENDKARWPCYFPSSVGIITARHGNKVAAFPCGSTSIMARHPFTVAICVSYGRINARYAPRASLDVIRSAGRFGCGVPIYDQTVLDAIAYLGNISLRDDPLKAKCSGLTPIELENGFCFAELPVHFDCRVVDEVRLGTHSMFLGEVEQIRVDNFLSPDSPLEWCPWAGQIAPQVDAS